MSKGRGRTPTYMTQLDSVRAIAVILVIISHWLAKDHFLNRYTNNGTMGVTLFFVLSGFLITGILLRNKINIENGRSIKQAYKVFYIRRSLRIFPVYYLLLFVLLLFNLFSIRESFWWHFFYGSNFYFWIHGKFEGSLSHLWSLAVEEQFYLIWPAVIFFTSIKYLQQLLLSGIVAAVLFRWFITTAHNDLGRILMPGSLDSFCIGGVLAYGKQFASGWYIWYTKKRDYFILLSVIILIFVHTNFFKDAGHYVQICCYYLFISISFGILIDRVANHVTIQPVNFILSNRVLLFIGKVSYGVYLFHNLIPYFYSIEFPAILQPFSFYIIQSLRFLVLILLSGASWFCFEKPILKLKRRFEFV